MLFADLLIVFPCFKAYRNREVLQFINSVAL